MRTFILLLAAALAPTLQACGQKGPLVLPSAEHPRKRVVLPKPPASSPPPAPGGTATTPGPTPGATTTPPP